MDSGLQYPLPLPQNFLRRTLIFGSAALALSMLSGITMLFWREYRTSVLRVPRQAALDLLTRATAGPVYLGFILFMITVPVVVSLVSIFYVGFRRRRLTLSVVPFLLLGAYWLWLVELIAGGALD